MPDAVRPAANDPSFSTSISGKRLFLFVAFLVVVLFDAFSRIGTGAEHLFSKHYFNSADGTVNAFYYSGWDGRFFVYDKGLKPLHMEPAELYLQAYGFLRTISPGQPQGGTFLQGGYQTARIFSASFLPSLIARLSGGTLTVIDSHLVSNVIVWLAAIFSIFKLTGMYTREPLAPYIAAMLLASWPVDTLGLDTIKMQFAGSAAFVIGLYLHESQVRRFGPMAMFIYYVAFWFIALQSSGGWPMFMVFMVWRFLWLLYKTPAEWPAHLRELTVVVVSIIPANLWINAIHEVYGLKSSLAALRFSFSHMIGDTMEFIWAFLRGQDIGSLRFANLPGTQFFTLAIPKIGMGFIHANPILAALGVLAFFFAPRTRWLLAVAPVLLFVGCGTIYVAGYVTYFGYFAGGAMTLVIIAVASMLADLFAKPSAAANAVAVISVAAAFFVFMTDYKSHMDNMIYDQNVYSRVDRIYVYHGKNLTVY